MCSLNGILVSSKKNLYNAKMDKFMLPLAKLYNKKGSQVIVNFTKWK